MSRNDWEHGEIKVPSAEFARIRKAVQDAETAHKEKVFAMTQDFWKSLTRKQQTDPQEYFQAHWKWHDQMFRKVEVQPHYLTKQARLTEEQVEEARDATAPSVAAYEPDPARPGRTRPVYRKPERVLRAKMKFPTNRTTEFDGGSGSAIFKRETSTIVWETDEGNRAVERARDSWLGRTLFETLGTVWWTRGTGGMFVGNDEYNEESGRYSHGAGGSYVTRGFGPVGAADPDAYNKTNEYLNSRGRRVRRNEFPGKAAQEKAWKAMARLSEEQGRRRNGQFDNKTYRESSGGWNALGRGR